LIEGSLLLISGQSGRIIRTVESPNQAESYYAPQRLVQPDGQDVILLGVGGFSSNGWGGVHAVPLQQLASGKQLTVSRFEEQRFKSINTTRSTIIPKGLVRFWSRRKAPPNTLATALLRQPKPDNTFWTQSTSSPKGIVRFWSSWKAPPYGEIHSPPPCCTTRTGRYFLD